MNMGMSSYINSRNFFMQKKIPFRPCAALFRVGMILAYMAFGYIRICSAEQFDISKVDVSKISKADIIATMKHREALYLELQAKYDSQQAHIVDQDKVLLDTTGVLTDLLNKEIPQLRAQIQTQTDRLNGCETSLAKASKALWWYRVRWWGGILMAIVGIIACVVVWGGKILVKLGLKSAI
jgi:hypothetical protein